jgi:hypothetical protein
VKTRNWYAIICLTLTLLFGGQTVQAQCDHIVVESDAFTASTSGPTLPPTSGLVGDSPYFSTRWRRANVRGSRYDERTVGYETSPAELADTLVRNRSAPSSSWSFDNFTRRGAGGWVYDTWTSYSNQMGEWWYEVIPGSSWWALGSFRYSYLSPYAGSATQCDGSLRGLCGWRIDGDPLLNETWKLYCISAAQWRGNTYTWAYADGYTSTLLYSPSATSTGVAIYRLPEGSTCRYACYMYGTN